MNTYKWAKRPRRNEAGRVALHADLRGGVDDRGRRGGGAGEANDFGHNSKDLHDAIDRGECPEWELLVQMMDDHDHPELDFEPLDDTEVWPEKIFPPKKVEVLQLNRNVENVFATAID